MRGPDISLFECVSLVALAGVGIITLILGALAGLDALLTHLRWIP